MRSRSAAEALAVNRSGGSQIRSMWQSAEITSYFIFFILRRGQGSTQDDSACDGMRPKSPSIPRRGGLRKWKGDGPKGPKAGKPAIIRHYAAGFRPGVFEEHRFLPRFPIVSVVCPKESDAVFNLSGQATECCPN